MLDIRFIRENPELVEEKSKQKGYNVDVKGYVKYLDDRLTLIQTIDEIRELKNANAIKAIKGNPSEEVIAEGRSLKEKEEKFGKELRELSEKWRGTEEQIPNVFPDDTPLGGEENNRQEKSWGDTKDKDFEVIDHQTWAEARGLLDFERGAKVAGNKFYFTKGALVELEFAILQLGLKLTKDHGFEPMLVPHMVNTRTLEGAGFSAKSSEEKQIYKIEDEDLNLIATAEIPMTGYHADEILEEKDLPKLYAGYSPAYRMEAGAYGKHSRGLYRVHQFNKLELYVFSKPEDSEAWHQKLLAVEEELCQALEIPYRVVRIAAGDLGAPAYKKFDVEYWSPSDKNYRELMSVSNVTDYQARRLNIRYKKADSGSEFVHTLNGTAAAMSRISIALIENHQSKDGTVYIPKALQSFMHGQTKI